MLNLSVDISEVSVNIPAHLRKVRSDKFWLHAAAQWRRLYYDFVPFRTGKLADTVRITPGQIEHTQIYAESVYSGFFNFRRDQHPLASRQWDKAAAPSRKPQLIREMQAYVDSGRLNLDQ